MSRPWAGRLGWGWAVGLAGLLVACAPAALTDPGPAARAARAEPLSAPEIYRRVAPAVAFVETELGTGSGALVAVGDARYVLTNAHVAWPSDRVRLTFADGSELLDVPLAGADLLYDLALLGPVAVDLPPLAMADGEALPIGSDVYLIGYPNEDETFPQPTIGRGLLGRVRQWDLGGLTLLQSDATIAGGQSGGVMVDDQAAVIGVTTWADGDVNGSYAVATSVTDLRPRLQGMLDGADTNLLGARAFPSEADRTRLMLRLDDYWRSGGLVLHAEAGTPITVSAVSPNDIQLLLTDTAGYELAAGSAVGTTTVLTATAEYDEPLVLVVLPLEDKRTRVRIESTSPLASIPDPDDGQSMAVGDVLAGALDYPGDADTYLVELQAGEPVVIRAESVRIDPILWVGAVDASDDEYLEDDDGGRGPFGTDARLWFEPPADGRYRIVVGDSFNSEVGGYLVTVQAAAEGDAP